MKNFVIHAATAALCLAALCPTASAQEEEVEAVEPEKDQEASQVEALRAEADDLARKRRYRKAIDKYKEVLSLRPYDYPAIYYNVAEMCKALEDYNQAALFYARYLELDPEATDAKAIERAIDQMQKKRGPGGTLNIKIEGPREALMIVDGVPLADSGQAKLDLAPGQYKVRATAKDFSPAEGTVTVRAGEESGLSLKLKELTYSGTLALKVNVDGAEIFVDGQKVGVSPLKEPYTLQTGKRFVELKKDGYHRWVRNVIIERDTQYDLSVNMGQVKQAQ